MLNSPAPYPYVGSYCLFEHEGRTTLARIVMRRWSATQRCAVAVIALPLVDGASGNMEVPETALVDATELTSAEARELRELESALADVSGRTPRQKAMKARASALRLRWINAPVMARLLRDASIRIAA